VAAAHEFFRRHWRRAIQLREKFILREEGLHLLIAGGVGVIGGLVNLAYFHAIEAVKFFFLRRPGDPFEVAEMLGTWERVLFPTLGGLVAGLVLHWGLRLTEKQRSWWPAMGGSLSAAAW